VQFARFTRILRVLLFIKPAHTQELGSDNVLGSWSRASHGVLKGR